LNSDGLALAATALSVYAHPSTPPIAIVCLDGEPLVQERSDLLYRYRYF
jgi:hypothetical protein